MATLSIAFNGTTRKTVTFDATEQAKMLAWYRNENPATVGLTDIQVLDVWATQVFRQLWRGVHQREKQLAMAGVAAPVVSES